MINNDRIVPIQKIDYLSMIGTIMKLAGVEYRILESLTTDGEFVAAAGTLLANQPVKTIKFLGNATVYYVAAYDFKGFTAEGVDVNPEHISEIPADGVTLYKATFSDGEVEIEPVTPFLM